MGDGVLETEITGIAAGGAGVGRLPDGRVTFVHRTAPGERVAVRLTESRRRWTRSQLVRIQSPSSARREAPCPHYDRCGGCTLEHMVYEAQLEAKGRLVADALQRIGKLSVGPPEVVPSPREFRYRNRVSFTLRRERGGVVAGFHELDRPDRIFNVTEACLLPEEPVAEAWGALRQAWGEDAHRLPSGDELRLTLRGTRAGAVSLAIDGGYAPGRPEDLVQRVGLLEAVWHRPEGAGEYRLLAGTGVEDRWTDEELELSGDVFTQVNRDAAALLEEHVLHRLRETGPARLLDAYCGVGLYARRLEREGVDVVGIEAHPDAVRQARDAVGDARVLEGRVEDRIAEVLPVDAVILNPPRTGLDPAVVEALREQPPQTILYVSCDPATLARDLKRLGEDFRLTGIRAFDLFPQTAHVETVVELECDIS